jgi:transcriptional regulator with XRE-family HTH domain
VTAREFYEARSELGLTQKQLAKALGRSLRIVTYYEAGGRPVNKTVERLLLTLVKEKNRRDEGGTDGNEEQTRRSP